MSRASIRGVFFDVGSTLLYADPPVEEVYFRAFSRDGARTTPREVAAALEDAWRGFRERTSPDRSSVVVGERELWREYVRRVRFNLDGRAVSEKCFGELGMQLLRSDSWSMYSDVVPVLAALRKTGIRLAVVSNWDPSLGALLEAHGLSKSFSAILSSGAERVAKPNSEIFRRACDRLGLRAEESLHVGDSREEDYEAARSAGLSALLLDRDQRHSDIEERIASLAELPERLRRGYLAG